MPVWVALLRAIYIHYPDGQGGSKLRLPFASIGTGRNINTVTKLAAMAHELTRERRQR